MNDVKHRWPTEAQLQHMDTAQLSALANALGVGRWVMDESRAFVLTYLWAKIAQRTNEEAS